MIDWQGWAVGLLFGLAAGAPTLLYVLVVGMLRTRGDDAPPVVPKELMPPAKQQPELCSRWEWCELLEAWEATR